MDSELLEKAKAYGFSDRQIAHLTGRTEDEVRAERNAAGVVPAYRLVDTCAAEFEAYTPYYYSTYDRGDDEKPDGRRRAEGSRLIEVKRRKGADGGHGGHPRWGGHRVGGICIGASSG